MAWAFEIQLTDEHHQEAIGTLVRQRQRLTGRPTIEILRDADIQALCQARSARRLTYIGKPNRYRALEAQAFLQRRNGEGLTASLEVEFDRAGIVFSRVNGEVFYDKALTAYHPHSGTLGPIDSFARRVHNKRIGGLWLYSYKDKLSMEEIDMFYQWYEKAFRRKLKRPKGHALGMKELDSDGQMPPLQEA